MIKQTFSGFVTRKGKRNSTIREWIGCGTEDELYEVHVDMQDEAATSDRIYPGDLVIEPATNEEIERFKGEAGEAWVPPHLR